MNCVMKRYMELISVNLSGTRDPRTFARPVLVYPNHDLICETIESTIFSLEIPYKYYLHVQITIYGDDHHGGKIMIDH